MQASSGEVLTCDKVVERLRIEEEVRVAKKSKSRVPEAKSVQVMFNLFNTENKENESTSKSSDQEDDDTKCTVCNRLWSSCKGKKSDKWVICDLCNE